MKIDLPIRGMHCAACVRTVEETARSVPGVAQAAVSFAAETASIEIDPALFQAHALYRALRDRGYRLVPDRRVYRVRGLDPARVSWLEDRLRSLPGVTAAAANYAASTVAAESIFPSDIEGLLRAEGLSPSPRRSVRGTPRPGTWPSGRPRPWSWPVPS